MQYILCNTSTIYAHYMQSVVQFKDAVSVRRCTTNVQSPRLNATDRGIAVTWMTSTRVSDSSQVSTVFLKPVENQSRQSESG